MTRFLASLLLLVATGGVMAQTPTPALPKPSLPQPATPVPAIPDAPVLPVKSAILMDYATGQVLAGQAADERVEPASITKVMVAYVLFHELKAAKVCID